MSTDSTCTSASESRRTSDPTSRASAAHPTSTDLVSRTCTASTTSCAQACESMSSSSASYEAVQAEAASGHRLGDGIRAHILRPSSGNEAATHCTRCTGEPSRANDARTEDHAPTRRSCSSAPSRAKLRPRNESAAVSVRVPRSWTTPMSCQSARSRRTPRNAPMCRAHRGRPTRRAPSTRSTGSHSSPVRPATGTVASAP